MTQGKLPLLAAELDGATNFVSANLDIDEMLRRSYDEGVPLGYSENVFSLYQPGWGFDRNDIYRTGVAQGWGMPVTVSVDGVAIPVASAEFIPSYVTSYGAGYTKNIAIGAKSNNRMNVRVEASFDQTTWGQKLEYAFDGSTEVNPATTWSTYAEPFRNQDEWVTVDFGQVVKLSAVNLFPFDDGGNSRVFERAVVQHWNNGEWQNVTNQKNPAVNIVGENRISFDAVSAEKFRIVVTPRPNTAAVFQEIEFLDDGGKRLVLNVNDQNASIMASAVYQVSFDRFSNGDKLFNGSVSTNPDDCWTTVGSPCDNGIEWVDLLFAQDVTLGSVNFFVCEAENTAPPISANVQVLKGSVWVDISGQIKPDGYEVGKNTISFDSVTGSRFRLVLTPAEEKALAFSEVEMNEVTVAKDVKIVGYKYISQNDQAVVIISAENKSSQAVTVEVTASSKGAVANGEALNVTRAGFEMIIKADTGFSVWNKTLKKTMSIDPGQTVEYRIAMSMNGEDSKEFFEDEDPLATQKESFNRWFLENIPYVDVPDEQIKQIYYFRWYTYRNHIRMTTDGYYIITEFLPNVGWAGLHNGINCPAGLHVAEGRWLRNEKYLDDYLYYWTKCESSLSYSTWLANAYYERYLVDQDREVLDYLEDFKEIYSYWINQRYDENMDLYFQEAGKDGMELAVGGDGYRPTINTYQYADAMAIAAMCEMKGDSTGASFYRKEAEKLKESIDNKLWDAEDSFYKVIRRGTNQTVEAKELLGYIPWMFHMPDDTDEFGEAWTYLMREDGFMSAYGPRTTEYSFAEKNPVSEYGGNICRWNGPSWPFATTQTLVALANVLNDYQNQTAVDIDDYYSVLKTYAQSQYKNGAPWIAENLDADNGIWIADVERSPNYNHSEFANLVITGLFGIRPDDSEILTVNPLISEDWDHFCLENVPYHDKLITILYDADGTHYGQGKGFKIYVNGVCVKESDVIKKVYVPLSESAQVPSEEETTSQETTFEETTSGHDTFEETVDRDTDEITFDSETTREPDNYETKPAVRDKGCGSLIKAGDCLLLFILGVCGFWVVKKKRRQNMRMMS